VTTALIAEDEPLLAQALKAELARLWPALRIVAEAGDGQQALQQALVHRPDICFFDIRMPGMDGLEAAQALAEDWPDGVPFPLIVFVTAYDQYALQAFDRAAVDYVLKPVQPERLAQTCTRLEAALRARDGQAPSGGIDAVMQQLRGLIATDAALPSGRLRVIQAGVGNLIHMVPVDEVLYFEAADKYVRVVTAEREHLVRISLKELQPQLDPQRFWQVHRGTIVRCDAIATALRDESGKLTLTLRGHADKLTVSRMYAHLFRGM
jgi:DNA-binding LytR/AlgR family response regulator